MKFLHSLLLPTVASSQLLGFGASCPSIEIEIENVGNVATSSLIAVAHSPDIELIPDNEPLTDGAAGLIFGRCDPYGGDPDGYLDEFLDDLPQSAFENICGIENEEGFVFVSYDDINDEIVVPGRSYDSIYLSPVNEGSCSCSNMRISILAFAMSICGTDYAGENAFSYSDGSTDYSIKAIVPINGILDLSTSAYGSPPSSDTSDVHSAIASSLSAAAYLNSHELQSTTTTSHTAAVYVGMTCSAHDRDCWAKPVSIASTSDLFDSFNDNDIYFSDAPAYSTSRAFSVTFIPVGSSSTSFLSLWALLMQGWY